MNQLTKLLALFASLGHAILLAPSCDAETLSEALVLAYSTNPTILAERARQRATDELVPQANAAWRPTVSLNASTVHNWLRDPVTQGEHNQSLDGELSITLDQPVFRGYATVEGVKSAEAQVRAGEQQLFAIEQRVLLGSVEAYMEVYANRLLVDLQRQNLDAVSEQLRGDLQRFRVGEITRTDLSQTRAQLSQAEAALARIVSDLAASEARYLEVIGAPPGQLRMPKQAKLPKSLESALQTAGQENPALLATAFTEEASYHEVGVARSALYPQITLQALAGASDNFLEDNNNESGITVQAFLSWQLYSGGATQSAIRQTKETASERRIEVVSIARGVRQAVTSAWSTYNALGDIVTSAKARVKAERLALEGVEEEYEIGTRTTLDVLNQRQALVAARVTQVIAERDRVIVAYQLLAAIGQLTLSGLGLTAGNDGPNLGGDPMKSKLVGVAAPSLY